MFTRGNRYASHDLKELNVPLTPYIYSIPLLLLSVILH